jgi:hypothetical protein
MRERFRYRREILRTVWFADANTYANSDDYNCSKSDGNGNSNSNTQRYCETQSNSPASVLTSTAAMTLKAYGGLIVKARTD